MKISNAVLKAMRKGIDIGNGWVFKLIPVSALNIDPSYQRDPKSVDNIKGDSFREDALGVLEVGHRKKNLKGGGKYWVTDGQHRLLAVSWRLDNGLPAPSELRCLVKLNTTPAIEAEMFCNKNSGRAVTGNNRFKAKLVYGHNPEARINDWVQEFGFNLVFRSAGRPTTADTEDNAICSPVTLLKVYNDCSDHIRLALQFLRSLYGKDCVPWKVRNGAVIGGIALFFSQSSDKNAVRVAARFKELNLDLLAGVERCKRNDGNCRNQLQLAKTVAEWIGPALGNGFLRKAAAA